MSVGTERAGAAGFPPTWGRANTIKRKKGGKSLFCAGGSISLMSDVKPRVLALNLSGHMPKSFSRCCARVCIWESGLRRHVGMLCYRTDGG